MSSNPLDQAKAHFADRQFADALLLFESAIKAQPTAEAYRGIGFCHLSINQPVAARNAFERGLDTCGPDPELSFGLAMAYEALGERLKAISALEDTIALDPDHVAARSCAEKAMADCTGQYLNEGNVNWAEEMIQRRLRLDPKQPDALAAKIELDMQLGRHAEAKRSFRVLRQCSPSYPGLRDLARKLGLERQRERGFLY